tara:strand:+ start:1502 stop:2014 length:513 start_codon:yes stop_codon:yes gene_type:complete
MKKEDGASNFFTGLKDRIDIIVENQKNNALNSAFGQEAGDLIRERGDVQNQFNKFNTASKENTNPFGNLAGVEAGNKQRDINQLTGEISQSIALNNAQNNVTDASNSVMDQVSQANPFKPNNNNDPNSPQGAPMSNGTGSGRPNFDEGATMSIKKVNEGAPMSSVLFKKK